MAEATILSGKPKHRQEVQIIWIWNAHTKREIIARYSRLERPERIVVERWFRQEKPKMVAPANRGWFLKIPGGKSGFLLGTGERPSTVIGSRPDGTQMDVRHDEVDITPQNLPQLKHTLPPRRLAPRKRSNYEITFAPDTSLDVLLTS